MSANEYFTTTALITPLRSNASTESNVKTWIVKRRKLRILESKRTCEGLFLKTPGGWAQMTGSIKLPKWCVSWENQTWREAEEAIVDNNLPKLRQHLDFTGVIERGTESLLTFACQGAVIDCVKLLLDYRADPNHFNTFYMTPSHFALSASWKPHDRLEILKLLELYGGDLNVQCAFGWSLLHRAAWARFPAALNFLKPRVDGSLRTSIPYESVHDGCTALCIAQIQQCIASSNVLMDQLPKGKCIVLDLDQTLILGESGLDMEDPDFTFQCGDHGMYSVNVRPHVSDFLNFCGNWFSSVCLFTAGTCNYAENILERIDPEKVVQRRRYRDSCEQKSYRKDLTWLWDDLSTIVLVDDRHTSSYSGQEDNLIQISRWNGEQDDTALRDMIPVLAELVLSDDFPRFLRLRKQTLRKSSNGSDYSSSSEEETNAPAPNAG